METSTRRGSPLAPTSEFLYTSGVDRGQELKL